LFSAHSIYLPSCLWTDDVVSSFQTAFGQTLGPCFMFQVKNRTPQTNQKYRQDFNSAKS